MSRDGNTLRLAALLDQGAKLGARLESARQQLTALGEMKAARVAEPSEEEARHIDVLLFRYMRMQDLLGGRLFPALLEAGAELPVESAYIDKLHTLERLGVIDSAGEWMELRALRNQMAHDDPDPKIRLRILLDALNSVPTLLAALEAAALYAGEKLGLSKAAGT